MKLRYLLLGTATYALGASLAAAATLYVNVNSSAPAWPYNDWSSAAANIQDAIDAANAGDQILVTNGVYDTGSQIVNGSLYNRVVINKAVTVRSVNGPTNTLIVGYQVPGTTNGDGAIRCVYLTNNAQLIGFTLTNGATRLAGLSSERSGGGAYCRASSSVLSNCVVVGNAASTSGGGVYQGTLYDCTLFSNTATNGGGTAFAALSNCFLANNRALSSGGASQGGALTNCTLTQNFAGNGGGAGSAILDGCMVTNNYAYTNGGGTYSCTMRNSTLTANSADGGGGAASGTLLNCRVTNNQATYGGGAYFCSATNCFFSANFASVSGGGAVGDSWSFGSVLLNCTLTGNSALFQGGGVWGCSLTNSIVYFNTAGLDPNWASSRLYYCCTTPAPYIGTNNIETDPQLASASHLAATSPCRGAGASGLAKATDIDNEPWANPPSIGCDESYSGSVTGQLSVAIQLEYPTVTAGWTLKLKALISGRASSSRWAFHDGTIVSNQPSVLRTWNTPGIFAVVLRAYNESYPNGISVTAQVQVVSQPVHYVSKTSTASSSPYSSWATAATNIQDAIDAVSIPGALVLVSNGVFSSGGRLACGPVTNRIAVLKPIEVRSLNGPLLTTIEGYQVPVTMVGDAAVRCAFLGPGAVLAGFTLTNGATVNGSSAPNPATCGGAILAASDTVISNCVIINNRADISAGGAFGGTLINCSLSNNRASSGGGCQYSTLRHCVLAGNHGSDGGGASYSLLISCVLSNNIAAFGGGLIGGAAYNCLFTANTAGTQGGGADEALLVNCTIVGNTGGNYGGGGVSGCTASNCIIYYNNAPSDWGTNYGGYGGGNFLDHCCTTPLPEGGADNFTNPPSLVNLTSNFSLQTNSPCINSGANRWVTNSTDIDRNPRIAAGTVDLGAYEFQNPASVLSYAWAQQYGLFTDGSADYTDADVDGMNNWQECIAGTNPTNALSALRVQPPAIIPPGLLLRWNSDTNHSYFVQRAISLTAPLAFSTLATNLQGLPGITSFRDTATSAGNNSFYRVGTFTTKPPALLRLQTPVMVPAHASITWSSVSNRWYCVERATNFPPVFLRFQSNIPGLSGTTSFIDTNPPATSQVFYRVAVQQ